MAESEDGPFSLYLRPKQPDRSEEVSLGYRFREIVAQKGHFRTVTQSTLTADEEEEAEDLGHDALEHEEESDDPDGGEKRGTLKHINDSKQKMVQMLSAAHEQAMFLVDFVSLLESKYSEAGQLSMSQGIRQVVPPKTLAYDEWPVQEPDEADRARNQLVAQGQRLRGLNATADDLLKAAARLQDDVKKETVYWDEVLSVTNGGWAVCRVSKGQHQLGVQLGFPQAGPLFRNRGFVPLAAGEGGTLRLGQLAARNPRKLRLRLCGAADGNGCNLSTLAASDDGEIEARIRAARDSLFEEELFHELTNEARMLANHGVKWKGAVVHIPMYLLGDLGPQGELQLDLVHQTHQEPPSSLPLLDDRASQIALALKLLMLHTYERRRIDATKPPAPLSERKKPATIATLLRPLIMHASHHTAVLQLRSYIDAVSRTLKLARIDFEAPRIDTSLTLGGDSAIDLINSVVGPCTTEVHIKLPSGEGHVLVTIRTETASEGRILESTYTIALINVDTSQAANGVHDDAIADNNTEKRKTEPNPQVFDNHRDLASHLNELWALDIAHQVIARAREGVTVKEQEPEVDIVQESANARPSSSIRLRVYCNATGLTLAWRNTHLKGEAGEYSWKLNSKQEVSLDEAIRDVLKPN